MGEDSATAKRGYDLRGRLENMDQTRRAVLQAARQQLEAQGYRQLTMASLGAGSGVTRQTIHNLFGSKRGVLEALFDVIALESGMERMRDVMTQAHPQEMLKGFVQVFCNFWRKDPVLLRRIHGIGAIDPEFGEIIDARNRRRLDAASRIARRLSKTPDPKLAATALSALTSFEFFDALTQAGSTAEDAEESIFKLASAALGLAPV